MNRKYNFGSLSTLGTKKRSKESSRSFWFMLFSIPFKPQWYVTFYLTICIDFFFIIYEGIFRVYGDHMDMFNSYFYVVSQIMAVCDLVLIYCYRKFDTERLYTPPTILELLLDVFAMLPLRVFATFQDPTGFFYGPVSINGNRIVRIYKIIQFFYRLQDEVGQKNVMVQVVQLLFYFYTFLMLFILIPFKNFSPNKISWYQVSGEILPITTNWEMFLMCMSKTISKMTARETLMMVKTPDFHSFEFVAIVLSSFLMNYFIKCSLTIALTQPLINGKTFLYRLTELDNKYKSLKLKPSYRQHLIHIYFILWKRRSTLILETIDDVQIPVALIQEIYLDIFWPVFKHSNLFYNLELTYLRHLSKIITQVFLLPGDLVFEKGKFKDKMVYISGGVLQILSEEDNETVVLSLSPGSCLGETSLVEQLMNTATVISKSYAEIYVLTRNDFIKTRHLFPKLYPTLVSKIKNKLCVIRKLHDTWINNPQYDLGKIYHISMLRECFAYFSKQNQTETENKITSCRLLSLPYPIDVVPPQQALSDLKRLLYISHNIKTFIISEHLELSTDSFFLKSTFPYLFHPESVFLPMWNWLIYVTVIYVAVIGPYMAVFVEQCPFWYITSVTFVRFIYVVDLFVQISTAIRLKDETITEINKIIYIRLGTLSFIADIISTLPIFQIIMFILEKDYSTKVNYLLFVFNKLIKIIRIEQAFSEMERLLQVDIKILRIVKFILYTNLSIYIIAAIITIDNNITFISNLSIEVFLSIQVVTGCMYIVIQKTSYVIVAIFSLFHIYGLFLNIFTVASILSVCIMHLKNQNFIAEQMIQELLIMLPKHANDKRRLLQRVNKTLEIQIKMENIAQYIDFPQIVEHPKGFIQQVEHMLFFDLLSSIPLFRELPNTCLIEILKHVETVLIPANEIVVYGGTIPTKIYIIYNGCCEVLPSVQDQFLKRKFLYRGHDISTVEMLLKLRRVHTVKTITDCQLIKISITKVFGILAQESSASYKALMKNITITRMEWQFSEIYKYVNDNVEDLEKLTQTYNVVEQNFTTFYDSEDYVYQAAFEKLSPYGFVRLLLMKRTINPNGSFYCMWEVGRSIFAVMTVAICMSPLRAGRGHAGYYILILLDLTAVVDIYVRMHVQYYNGKGILITHPLNTVSYYIQHSFTTDLLAVSPLFLVNRRNCLLWLNRLLQLYRFIGGCNYLEKEKQVSVSTIRLLKIFILILLMLNAYTGLLLDYYCEFDDPISKNATFYVNCTPNTWILSNSTFATASDPVWVFLYGWYFVTSTLTLAGATGFAVNEQNVIFHMSILIISGYIIIYCFLYPAVIASTIAKNLHMLSFQREMRSLANFLSMRKIRLDIRLALKKYYQYIWINRHFIDRHKLLNHFPTALQEDILFSKYGQTLRNSPIFKEAHNGLIRFLLRFCTIQYITKDGYVSKVNNICDTIFIIYEGCINVIGPDESLLVVLGEGSVFGNLDNISMTRQTLTYVARGHSQLLAINSLKFYEIIRWQPQFYTNFCKQTAIHIDYLPGNSPTIAEDPIEMTAYYQYRHKIFLPRWKILQIWHFLITVLCFETYLIELFQLATSFRSLYLTILHLILDLIYLVHVWTKFHTAYIDAFGTLVTNILSIKNRYISSLEFKLDMIMCLPINLIGLWFYHDYYLIYLLTRINKLLRVYYIYKFIHRRQAKFESKILKASLLSIVIWAVLIFHTIICLQLLLYCTGNNSMRPPVLCPHHKQQEEANQQLYLKTFYIVLTLLNGIFFREISPGNTVLTVYFIMLMLLKHFIWIALMGALLQALQSSVNDKRYYENIILRKREFLLRSGLSQALLRRYWEYVCLLWRICRGSQFPVLIFKSPYYLKEGAMNSLFGTLITQNTIFQNEHPDFLRQLVATVSVNTFFNGNYIVFKGDINECMYFVYSGEVAAVQDVNNVEKIIEILPMGRYFGTKQGLYEKYPYDFTYKALKHSVIVILQRKHWKHLLDFFVIIKDNLDKKVMVLSDKSRTK